MSNEKKSEIKMYYVKWVDKKNGKLRIALTAAPDMATVKARIKSDLKQDLPEDLFVLELPSQSNLEYVYHETRELP